MAVGATVAFESAGTHKFHLSHINQSGGPDLILKALQAINLHERCLHWRVIVQKQLSCGGDTPVFKVVGWKRGQVELKIKPGDVRSCHRVVLVVPSAFKAQEIYHSLKEIANQFDKQWRTTPIRRFETILGQQTGRVIEEPTAMLNNTDFSASEETIVTPSQVEPSQEPLATVSPVKGIINDPTRTRTVLKAIYELSGTEFGTQADFVQTLANTMNWGDVTNQRHTIAGMFASFTRRGYIVPVKKGSLQAGYTLTHAGMVYIRDLLPSGVNIPDLTQATTSAEKPAPVVPQTGPPEVNFSLPLLQAIDPIQLVMDVGGMAHVLADLSQRLRKNREEHDQYQTEIDRLNAEAESMLAGFTNNKETQLLLHMLLERHQKETPPTEASQESGVNGLFSQETPDSLNPFQEQENQ